ncbi:MAG: GtrA family protein [Clostridia bacterium]|nr:GtrA family protein [Clostridia bacterium]
MKALYEKYKTIILYLFFGVLTTFINVVSFYVLSRIFSFGTTIPANICAWFLSVVFAFVTNKYFVFDADKSAKNSTLFQLLSFFAARLFSGVLDIIIVFVFADLIKLPDMPVKIISNVLVIIINYVASRLVIFR